MSTILFIGLGRMGSGMAANLMKAGHDVYVHDLSKEAVEEAVRGGGREAGLADAAEADVVLTMLPAGEHVAKIYLERGGVAAHARQGTLFIDCSTIDVETAREVIEVTEAHGYDMVDAPVSGGIAAANAGTLTFMVGGTQKAFKRAEPILQAMGKAVIHAGDAGNGQAAKICNNMLLAIQMIGTAEAFAMAQKLGLDAQTFYDISSVSSGQCWSMTSYCPVPGVGPESPADRGYAPGFAAALMVKDLRLAIEAAEKAGAKTELGSHAKAIYEAFAEENGGVDFSGIITTL
jgi:3-hydroxyisobutyrate dehydrogenase